MFVVTAILSCIIRIRGLFKSTKWRHFKNVKFEALSARHAGVGPVPSDSSGYNFSKNNSLNLVD